MIWTIQIFKMDVKTRKWAFNVLKVAGMVEHPLTQVIGEQALADIPDLS